MAYTTIKKSTDYFNTVLYTGNATDNTAITGVGFQPDFTWIKIRNIGYNHRLQDSVRGATKSLLSNATSAEQTNTDAVKSFNSDGFVLGTDISNGSFNSNGNTFVSWNWLGANGTSANTDGSISSTVSANTTSGFSIVTYTGGGGNATVGHGLGVAPGMMIIKNISASQSWVVYHQSIGNTKNLYLNNTDATNTTSGWFNNTSPTSTVFTIGNDGAVSGNGNNLVAYCFAEKQGYSKFGSYTGNGSTDGTFVYTGFKPAFVMTKRTDATSNWHIFDSKRDVDNGVTFELRANTTDAETDVFAVISQYRADFLSNGFKIKTTESSMNASGGSYIYMAFAEQPLVGDNPATAR
jgi:hypothetical protein